MQRNLYVYKFGPFHLDVAERLLLRDGQVVHLTPKLFDILLILIRERGHLVEKDELMYEIWSNSIVEDNNLTVHISMLRKILGDRHGKHKYIQTVPKRGYRFVAGVKEVLKNNELEKCWGKGRKKERHGQRDKGISSIAVLPLVNRTNDTNIEYLCDGITEGLIHNLSQLSSLRVMARSTVFRYKERNINPLEAAQEMSVDAVLSGKVISLNDLIEIRMELVDVSDGSQIWGERYSRRFSDILATQQEITERISERLGLRLPDEERIRLAKRYTANTEAYHLYLKGRYFWNKYTYEGIKKAIDYFQQAIKVDPGYALAYAGLADSYQRVSTLYVSPKEALPKAKAAARKSVELDAELSEAYTSLGLLKIYYDHDWIGAKKDYERAIELNPGEPLAYRRYAQCLMLMGRFNEALAEHKTAIKLDPLSLQNNVTLGTNLYLLRRFDEAIKQLEKTLELDQNYCPSHLVLGCVYLEKGDLDQAIVEFRLACQLEKKSSLPLGFLGHACAIRGKTHEAEKILNALKSPDQRRYISPYSVAITYIGLGKTDKAIKWLQRAYEEHSDWLVWLRVGPELDSIRSDPKFRALMRLIGFKS